MGDEVDVDVVHNFVDNVVVWWRVGAGFRLTSWIRRSTHRWGKGRGMRIKITNLHAMETPIVVEVDE